MACTPRSTSSTSSDWPRRRAPAAPKGRSEPRRRPEPGLPEPDIAESGHPSSLLDVGRIVKPHGLRGELVVELWTNRTERVAEGSVLWSDDGRRVVIASSRPHQGRYLVWLEGVGSLEEAESLRSRVLRAPEMTDPDVLWVHELVGARVVTADGRPVGTVSTVEANPASDLLVLDGGHLIPLTFVVELVTGDGGERTVVVDLPAGLLE